MSQSRTWQVFVDTGGTFTDAIGLDGGGRLHRVKVLSSGALRGSVVRCLSSTHVKIEQEWGAPRDFPRGFRFRLLNRPGPSGEVERFDPVASMLVLSEPLGPEPPPGAPFELLSPEEAPVLAARLLAGVPSGRPLPVSGLRLATTRGTNALLERQGVPLALFVTRGFRDLLRIGTQQRPELFALEIRKPEPLYAEVVEVPERLAADGAILEPLAIDPVTAEAKRLSAKGIRVAAVALLHSYRNPQHEEELRAALLKAGFTHVSCSADLTPTVRLLPRAETAVVNAYLAPVIQEYLDRVRAQVPSGRLHVMTSAGGLVSAESFRPKDSLLSGPAGGVVGAARAARASGFDRVIVFDMGGTSTDAARFDGDYEYLFEHRVADVHLKAPALAIESVAAGGGSICWFDGDRLRVGPRSAGAMPGPACYGAGGPLTLTDVNLLLGRIDEKRFEVPIAPAASRHRLAQLLDDLSAATGERPDADAVLEGFLDIADERMADAIRRVSLRRGYDPAAYTLVAFGGAGGQHACGVARRLGIDTILIPRDASLLSALGLGAAVLERFAEQQVLRPLAEVESQLPAWIKALAEKAAAALVTEGIPRGQVEIRRRLASMRLIGQDAVVEVPYADDRPLAESFLARYAELFGHSPEGRALDLESLRVIASAAPSGLWADDQAPLVESLPATCREARIGGARADVPVHERDSLRPGKTFEGPALIFERHSATVIETGWRARVDEAGGVILSRGGAGAMRPSRSRPEAVRLELFINRFRSIAADMGERLRRTAVSTNIKERLDFSCALLDAAGELVVNAPHIPVHLGAVGMCVRRLMEFLPMGPGDVVVTNHPSYGGSHLPDTTVVTPVFDPRGDAASTLLGFVASRAHHAEIGGISPGSMPPAATRLSEEAVVIPPTYILRGGRSCWEEVRRLLGTCPFPSRAIEDNLSDLRAAVAANHAGAQALIGLASEHGPETVRHYMAQLTNLAERGMRQALRNLPSRRYEALEHLDDSSPLRVQILVEDDRATIDFTGSADVHPGNLNATPAIVNSAVIYTLRLLIRDPLPLNEGLMRVVSLRIPHGILNPGFDTDIDSAPAITGGNVETSQRLVDTLIKAFGLAACSQGTMNNVIFGNERFGYYETLGGGSGAGPGFHGASGVHTHMTNTRITDPEVIEIRYPARVERFELRKGSAGAGRYRGGEGVLRQLLFLERMILSVLSQHRTVPPYGLAGGVPGQPGAQRVVRASGEILDLGPLDGCDVAAGDRLIIETPGGGGYGSPPDPAEVDV